ncbi:LPS assembly protein LptD, partial [Pelagibacterales bacterium SAG-MED20]|nr:LPS assembly protein LptD [Pelagibacterales bacterium SAG-MED20]
KTKDIRDNDRRLDLANIYSLNRIGDDDNVEEGASLTYGFEYIKSNKSNREILEANLANVLRVDENENLPNQSSLDDKTSDIVGSLTYSPNEILKFNYDFSLDNNLNDTNYQLINSEFKVNNFITSFEYLNENKTKSGSTYITNKTSYDLDESNNLIFEVRENKKTGLTEFYNLIYQYKNDCLKAAIEYNKDYYDDGELKPQENIFFKLTIIPFGETSTTNLLR